MTPDEQKKAITDILARHFPDNERLWEEFKKINEDILFYNIDPDAETHDKFIFIWACLAHRWCSSHEILEFIKRIHKIYYSEEKE